MRAQRIALLVALALAVTTAGAGTAATTGQGLDLSTTEAIDAYLVSIGVDPATVVRQNGPLNYAGPSCPGPDWNCTTSRKVVQLSQVGGQNAFVCEPDGTGSGDACLVVQPGPGGTNRAECRLESDTEPIASQSCTITQTGERNSATVRMLIDQSAGPTQDARQIANVTQTATEKNELHVYQTVRQKITTGDVQKQDAFQVAVVDQTATGTVGNFSHVHQVQDQDLSGAATSQQQNAAALPAQMVDCAVVKATNPNQCANIEQDADSGMNDSHLHQTIAERASSNAESSVFQGRSDGGNEAHVHQENGPDGQNVNKARGTVAQRVFLPDGSPFPQQATDPGCCGVGSQIGGKNNVEDINLSTTQSSKPEGFQFAQSVGSSNTPGRCSITLKGRNNSDAEAFTASEPGPCFLVVQMTCESSPPGGGDFSALQATGDCTTADVTEPPIELLGLAPVFTPLTATPTFGLPIEMPDFGEPADFLSP